MDRYEILGLPIERLSADEFITKFVTRASAGEAGYVCVPNVHQCIVAYDDPAFAEVVRNSAMIMSDSTVLHKFVAHKYDLPAINVLRGDQLTLALCRRAAAQGVPVALVGGKDDVVLSRMVAALLEQVRDLEVVFSWSPPFADISQNEEEAMLSGIRMSGARILFVGLGCPKQERWMARYTGRIPLLMIGVGAAFDFISGEVATSPNWIHGAGLEWLHRLVAEPRRLWKRYLSTCPRFVWLYLTRERWGTSS